MQICNTLSRGEHLLRAPQVRGLLHDHGVPDVHFDPLLCRHRRPTLHRDHRRRADRHPPVPQWRVPRHPAVAHDRRRPHLARGPALHARLGRCPHRQRVSAWRASSTCPLTGNAPRPGLGPAHARSTRLGLSHRPCSASSASACSPSSPAGRRITMKWPTPHRRVQEAAMRSLLLLILVACGQNHGTDFPDTLGAPQANRPPHRGGGLPPDPRVRRRRGRSPGHTDEPTRTGASTTSSPGPSRARRPSRSRRLRRHLGHRPRPRGEPHAAPDRP